MNQKIETESASTAGSEFSPSFLRWLVALTVATLAFLLMNEWIGVWRSTRGFDSVRITAIPWVTAGGIVIWQGLDMFSGKEPQPATEEERLGMVIALLLGFVVGPTLLLFSWRTLTTQPPKSPLSPANIGFLFGAVITSVYFIATLLSSVVHPQVAASMRDAQALGENRDKVIADLSHVAFDAVQYRMVPRALGGGAGSYKGYEIPAALRKTDEGEYSQIETGDTTIVVLGSSTLYSGAAIKAVYGKNGTLRGAFQFMGQFN